MNADQSAAYWMEMADYDLDTAKAMYRTERYLYVGFMAHQAIEKALKSYHWRAARKEPPYSHDLWKIAKSASAEIEADESMVDLFDELQPLNIEARYPKDKEALMRSLNREYCESLLARTEVCLAWIKAKP
ncbi:MAG: HEPN domain-containing protein [Treponema sp.]|nr:HEPN domain-containing protein [Treponema sp.]